MTTKSTLFLSKKGFQELDRTIQKLKDDITSLRNTLRESDAPDTREERLAKVERLARLDKFEKELEIKEAQRASAKLLPRKRDRLKVALGSAVEIMDQQGRVMRYTIVSSLEANPLEGRISDISPLGKNLIGKTVRDTVEYASGKLQPQRFKLVAIH